LSIYQEFGFMVEVEGPHRKRQGTAITDIGKETVPWEKAIDAPNAAKSGEAPLATTAPKSRKRPKPSSRDTAWQSHHLFFAGSANSSHWHLTNSTRHWSQILPSLRVT
jgi:hypothetical protein